MIIFLDFDGVLHPCSGSAEGAFCYLERFEDVLRDFPSVRVVLSTSWRVQTPLKHLVDNFSADIRERIDGATPVINQKEPPYKPYVRHREILMYLDRRRKDGHDVDGYVILDDDQHNFPENTPHLILCHDGFNDEEEVALRAVLEACP